MSFAVNRSGRFATTSVAGLPLGALCWLRLAGRALIAMPGGDVFKRCRWPDECAPQSRLQAPANFSLAVLLAFHRHGYPRVLNSPAAIVLRLAVHRCHALGLAETDSSLERPRQSQLAGMRPTGRIFVRPASTSSPLHQEREVSACRPGSIPGLAAPSREGWWSPRKGVLGAVSAPTGAASSYLCTGISV